jgi:hypothetical protein
MIKFRMQCRCRGGTIVVGERHIVKDLIDVWEEIIVAEVVVGFCVAAKASICCTRQCSPKKLIASPVHENKRWGSEVCCPVMRCTLADGWGRLERRRGALVPCGRCTGIGVSLGEERPLLCRQRRTEESGNSQSDTLGDEENKLHIYFPLVQNVSASASAYI